MTLPKAFDERIRIQLGDEYEDYIKCFDSDMYHGIRVNTSKISVEDFLKISPFELEPVPWTKNGFYYDHRKYTPSKHPYYYAGLYYIQEPSAMTPASVLDIEDGDVVLDICAAPGGKSTELAAKLNGTGILISNDISNSRAKALLKNLELFGIGNLCVVSEPPNNLSKAFEGTFDKILIDAPCSGEGMFRKDKKMVKAWEEHGPEFFSNLQRNIILQAARMLKPGGLMLYSTCTFDPGENERIIEHLKKEYPEFHVLPMESYEGFCPGIPEVTEEKDEELKKTVEKLKKEKFTDAQIVISRFKGLGEMDADQLWDTTMNPDTRILRQVNIENAAEADRIFSMLMGDEVPPRREFIEKNAHYANIDA